MDFVEPFLDHVNKQYFNAIIDGYCFKNNHAIIVNLFKSISHDDLHSIVLFNVDRYCFRNSEAIGIGLFHSILLGDCDRPRLPFEASHSHNHTLMKQDDFSVYFCNILLIGNCQRISFWYINGNVVGLSHNHANSINVPHTILIVDAYRIQLCDIDGHPLDDKHCDPINILVRILPSILLHIGFCVVHLLHFWDANTNHLGVAIAISTNPHPNDTASLVRGQGQLYRG